MANATSLYGRACSIIRAKGPIVYPKSLLNCSYKATDTIRTSCTYRHSSTSTENDISFSSTTTSAGPPSQSAHHTQSSSSINSYVTGPTTHFGYENVSINEKEGRVKQVFENVADNYDVMNDFMSAGLHRYWKDELLKMTGVEPMSKAVRRRASMNYANTVQQQQQQHSDGDASTTKEGSLLSILDVAGGTGDVAFRFIDAANCTERAKSSGNDEISVTVCDINPEMLRVGEKRARTKYGSDL